MASVLAFITTCADLERGIGALYHRFAGQLGPQTAAGQLFSQLAAEEDGHARALDLVSRLLRGVKNDTRVAEDFERLAREMATGLEKANALLDSGRPLVARQALELAIRLESTAIEAHSPQFVETDSQDLRRTIAQLVTETRDHKTRLAELLTSM